MKGEYDLVDEIVLRIRPLLAGHPPHIQGGVIAELASTWIAGHVVKGNAAETDRLRADLLAGHRDVVARLIPLQANMMGTEA